MKTIGEEIRDRLLAEQFTPFTIVATDGSWLVTVPGGALGGTADIAIAGTKNGLYQCALAPPGPSMGTPSHVR